MNFAKLFHKSNSSIHQIQGNVLECTIEQLRGNKVIVDTGMRASFVCFRDELCDTPKPTSSSAQSLRCEALPERWTEPPSPAARCRQVPIANSGRGGPTGPYKLDAQQRRRREARIPNLDAPSALLCPFASSRQPSAESTQRQLSIGSHLADVLRRRRLASIHSNQGAQHKALGFIYLGSSNPSSLTKPSGSCVIGIEEKRSPLTGEFTCSAPKSMEKISKRKLVWTELSKLWRTGAKNHTAARKSPEDARISGFILNSVNGGYAVAIAGYIAFLPKSLCINKKVFIGQWRQFAIIGMNPKIANIVVKEIKTAHQGARFAEQKRAQWNRKMKDRHSKR